MFDGIEYRGFKQEDVEDLAKYQGSGLEWFDGYLASNANDCGFHMTLKERFGSLGRPSPILEMVEIYGQLTFGHWLF
ncbi:MAG: hypothetical protein ACLS3V_00985 [Streptococcus sp.]